jgi:PAS domain S-box-containing protein
MSGSNQRAQSGGSQSIEASVILIDNAFRVVSWDERAERLLGLTRDQAIGRPISELIFGASEPDRLPEIQVALRQCGRWRGAVDAPEAGGAVHCVAWTIKELNVIGLEREGFLAVGRDLTSGQRWSQALSRPEGLRTGMETLLLVEDEELVRKATYRNLSYCGYHVLQAATPMEAMALFREHLDEVVLLISDVIMPELSGPQLYARLVSMKPSIKVLFVSGYTRDYVLSREVNIKDKAFIQKPFSLVTLAREVRELLDR